MNHSFLCRSTSFCECEFVQWIKWTQTECRGKFLGSKEFAPSTLVVFTLGKVVGKVVSGTDVGRSVGRVVGRVVPCCVLGKIHLFKIGCKM